jgi:hypothetical protein
MRDLSLPLSHPDSSIGAASFAVGAMPPSPSDSNSLSLRLVFCFQPVPFKSVVLYAAVFDLVQQ